MPPTGLLFAIRRVIGISILPEFRSKAPVPPFTRVIVAVFLMPNLSKVLMIGGKLTRLTLQRSWLKSMVNIFSGSTSGSGVFLLAMVNVAAPENEAFNGTPDRCTPTRQMN